MRAGSLFCSNCVQRSAPVDTCNPQAVLTAQARWIAWVTASCCCVRAGPTDCACPRGPASDSGNSAWRTSRRRTAHSLPGARFQVSSAAGWCLLVRIRRCNTCSQLCHHTFSRLLIKLLRRGPQRIQCTVHSCRSIAQRAQAAVHTTVEASCCEIYNDTITDLLAADKGRHLSVGATALPPQPAAMLTAGRPRERGATLALLCDPCCVGPCTVCQPWPAELR